MEELRQKEVNQPQPFDETESGQNLIFIIWINSKINYAKSNHARWNY